MREKIIKLYQFGELSAEGQEKAIETVRGWDDLYAWNDDNVASAQEFASHFGLSKLDWSVGPYTYSHASANIQHDRADLKGVRLFKFLMNSGLLRKGGKDLLGGECPFTGCGMDEALLDPIRKFMERPDPRKTYQELINDCLESWVAAWKEDWEHTYTDESIKQLILANEYEFTENGKLA